MLKENLPILVYHADWGTAPKKRWLCKAIRVGGGYTARAPALVGDHFGLLHRIKGEVGATGVGVVGFDFPIGIPTRYARLLGVTEFKPFFTPTGTQRFCEFLQRFGELCRHFQASPFLSS
jgi:hypothetical protein